MTSNYQQEQHLRRHLTDGNTSDDSLLLMVDDGEDRTPLLNDMNHTPTIAEEILPSGLHSLSIHCHVPDDKFDFGSRNRLILVLFICILFMAIEIAGGILSKSIAIMTDAAHMAIDVASFLISITAIYLARKKPTKKLSFGYIRAEVLGALISVLTIWLMTGILVYIAVERCIHRDFQVNSLEMLIVSSCGVFFNIVMFFILHANVCGDSLPHHGHSHGGGGGHGHSHGNHHEHSHSEHHNESDTLINAEHIHEEDCEDGHGREVVKAKKSGKNINVRAAMIHVIGDFVQSVGVLCAAILIHFKPEYKLADPICTFIFSILVLFTTITIMRDIVLVLMEGVPSNVSYEHVVEDLLHLPGVRNAHSLHIWSLSAQKAALSVHIAIDPDRDFLMALNQAQEMLRSRHSIARTTIQVEPYDEHVMSSCENCRRPGS